MVKRIAEHDSDLIETLKNDIEQLETSKSALETEKLTLEMKQEEQVEKKEEFNSYLFKLSLYIQAGYVSEIGCKKGYT